ncbi:MAG: 50S ribosomal protein L32 [Chloroflexi bacterium]|nr:50S ribosomal protein L32 [Chloroflexota bacterium]
MPPHPKKKRTHAKRGWRWSHFFKAPLALSTCAQCHNPKPTHVVCPTCGYYGGREVIVMTPEESAQGA